MKRIILPATLSVLLLMILAACSQNPVGIFASVARERLILDDRALENDLTVGSITRAGDRYFMASVLLRFRDVDNPASLADGNPEEWSVIPSPGSDADNYTTTSVVSFGGDVYATFVRQDGEVSGVYRVTNPTSATPELELVFESGSGILSVGELFVAGGELLVSVQTGSAAYTLRYWDGSDFVEVPGIDETNESNSAWTDVAADGSGSFLYVSGSKVLLDAGGISTGAAVISITSAVTDGDNVADPFRSAHHDGGNTFWIANRGGRLFSATDANDLTVADSWARNTKGEDEEGEEVALPPYTYDVDPDEAIAFTDFATISTSVSTDVTVVGTEDAGYYLLGATATVGPSSPSVDGSNYRESELSGLAITTFYADNANLRTDYPVPTAAGDPYELIDGYLLFAGTANGGLWRALFYDGAIQWVRE